IENTQGERRQGKWGTVAKAKPDSTKPGTSARHNTDYFQRGIGNRSATRIHSSSPPLTPPTAGLKTPGFIQDVHEDRFSTTWFLACGRRRKLLKTFGPRPGRCRPSADTFRN